MVFPLIFLFLAQNLRSGRPLLILLSRHTQSFPRLNPGHGAIAARAFTTSGSEHAVTRSARRRERLPGKLPTERRPSAGVEGPSAYLENALEVALLTAMYLYQPGERDTSPTPFAGSSP